MRRASLFILLSLLPVAAFAQAPAASGGATKIAIINFERAMTENDEGKKMVETLMGEVTKRQTEFDATQRSLDEAQTKLRTQDRALSDAARLELTRQIDQLTTTLNRMNEDAQKELAERQQQLFRPIGELTSRVLNAYATEAGYAIIFDVSSQANSIIYAQPTADITDEIIRRVNAEAAKTPAQPQ
jgi:outer membrane protein